MSDEKVKAIFATIIIVGVMIWLSGIVAENYGGGAACIFFIAAWLFGVPAVLFGPDYVSQWLNEKTDGRFGCGEIFFTENGTKHHGPVGALYRLLRYDEQNDEQT